MIESIEWLGLRTTGADAGDPSRFSRPVSVIVPSLARGPRCESGLEVGARRELHKSIGSDGSLPRGSFMSRRLARTTGWKLTTRPPFAARVCAPAALPQLNPMRYVRGPVRRIVSR